MGTIKIKGYATKEVNADIIEINISFTAKNAKIAIALEEAKKQSELFLKEISLLGIDVKEFHLGKDKSNEDGYGENKPKIATRTLTLCCKFNPKIINAIISVITKNNLEASIDTNYHCSNQQEIQKELLQEAIQNSRTKAETLASANGQMVKYAESITDDRDDCYGKKGFGGFLSGAVGDILLDEDLLSNALSAKPIEHSETVYVTWVIE